MGSELRLSPVGNSAAAALPPFIRPEHRAAALLPCGAPAGQVELQLVPAEGPSANAAAWLLADELQQQLALPLVEEGRPVCLWWRVMAGAQGRQGRVGTPAASGLGMVGCMQWLATEHASHACLLRATVADVLLI